jgi:very-short-patch-repair endonuclease
MTAFDLDRSVAALARRQHGAFSYRQAIDAGATPRIIARRRSDQRWWELDHHVYALPAHPPSWLRQAKAAELRFPDGAISGRSAGVIWGLAELRPGAIEVTIPRSGRGGRTPLARVRQRDGVATTMISDIRVVAAPEVIADLAGIGDPVLLGRAVDDVLLRHHAEVEELVARQLAMVDRRQRGAALLGSILEERATGYEPPTNVLEAALYGLLDRSDLPPYVRQSPLPWWPDAPQRVDAYVPSWRRIIEADGRAWHARHLDFERDRRRDHLAQAHGVEVTRFTYRQLVREPAYALAMLRALAAAPSSDAVPHQSQVEVA